MGTAPDTLYLHDMAVLPGMAGQGLARRLLQPLWEQAAAQGLRQSALVSVQGSEGYWQRHGYVAQPLHQPELGPGERRRVGAAERVARLVVGVVGALVVASTLVVVLETIFRSSG